MEPANIKDISVNTEPPENRDVLTKAAFEEVKNRVTLSRSQTKLDNLIHSFRMSNYLSIGIFIFVIVWMIAVFCFLIYQSRLLPPLRLTPAILISLLTTTTVNILSFLYLVIKYVFHHRLRVN
jgi:hypothetical protein